MRNPTLANYVDRRKADRRAGDVYVDAAGFGAGIVFVLTVQVFAWLVWVILKAVT